MNKPYGSDGKLYTEHAEILYNETVLLSQGPNFTIDNLDKQFLSLTLLRQ